MIAKAAVAFLALALPGIPALAAGEAPPVAAGSAPAPEEELTVVVTGARAERVRADSPALVEVITRSQIEARGAETVAEVLASQPGVEVEQSYRGFTMRLQGLDPEYVLVLVDGERTQGQVGGAQDLSRFSVDDIERIEILKGGASALYGSDAVAGVVNIITRRARRPIEVGGHASWRSAGNLDAAYRGGLRTAWGDALLSVGHHRAPSWDLTPDTPGTTSSAFRSWEVTFAGSLHPGKVFRLDARMEYLRRRQDGVDAGAAGAVFDRKTLTEQASFTLEPRWRLGERGRIQLAAHYGLYADQFLSDQRGSDALDQFQKTREQLGRLGAQLDHPLGGRNLFTAGVEGILEQTTSARLASGKASRQRGAVYAQDEWTVLDRPRLVLVPGVRLDGDSHFGAHGSPKLALRLDPHPDVVVRASYGWGFRAPSFQELHLFFENPGAGYRVDGNPALQPERSRSANLGAEWRPLPALLLSTALFRTDIDDMILVALSNPNQMGTVSQYTYANVASAHTQGLESGAGVSVRGFRVDASYALTLARDEAADRPLEGRARHRWTLGLGYRHPGIGFSVSARSVLVGQRPFYLDPDGDGVAQTEWARPYAQVGLRVGQVVWRAIEVFAGIDNLLDDGEERYSPLAPRVLYVGMNFTR